MNSGQTRAELAAIEGAKECCKLAGHRFGYRAALEMALFKLGYTIEQIDELCLLARNKQLNEFRAALFQPAEEGDKA